jgi:hypothetical protein
MRCLIDRVTHPFVPYPQRALLEVGNQHWRGNSSFTQIFKIPVENFRLVPEGLQAYRTGINFWLIHTYVLCRTLKVRTLLSNA